MIHMNVLLYVHVFQCVLCCTYILACALSEMTTWWRHQMETFSVLLAICAGNSPVTGEFTSQKPVTRSFDVFFDLHLNKSLSKQAWGWWSETPSRSLRRHCNENKYVKSSNMDCIMSWHHWDPLVPLSHFWQVGVWVWAEFWRFITDPSQICCWHLCLSHVMQLLHITNGSKFDIFCCSTVVQS